MLELNPKKEKPSVPVSKNENLNYYEKKTILVIMSIVRNTISKYPARNDISIIM